MPAANRGPDPKIATHFNGPLLAGGGLATAKRRRFMRNFPTEFAGNILAGRFWRFPIEYTGAAQANGGNTTLHNVGPGVKLGGDVATASDRSNAVSGAQKDGSYKMACATPANSETVLMNPRAFDVSCPVATDGPITMFIRMKVEDIASQDFLWGLVSDDVDAVSLLDAGGAENITDGVVVHRVIEDATNILKISVVATGTPALTSITLKGVLKNDTYFDMGLIISRGSIEYFLLHDSSLPDSEATTGIISDTTSIGVKNLLTSNQGPGLAVNSTDAATEYFSFKGWGVSQPYA